MKTKTGFSCKVDDRIKSDWRFVSAIAKMQSGNDFEKISACDEVVRMVTGDKFNDFVEHIRKNNGGYAPIEAVMEELSDLLTSDENGKK